MMEGIISNPDHYTPAEKCLFFFLFADIFYVYFMTFRALDFISIFPDFPFENLSAKITF